MKTTIKFFVAVSFVAFFTSCQNEEIQPENHPVYAGASVTGDNAKPAAYRLNAEQEASSGQKEEAAQMTVKSEGTSINKNAAVKKKALL